MAKMHSRGKGRSCSMRPYSSTAPTFMKGTIAEIKNHIIAMAKKNHQPAQIGAVVRDEYGVGNVKDILGCSLLEFLRENNCAPAIPTEIENLIERVNTIRKHLSQYKKDNSAKYRLILTTSKLHRLMRYYKQKNVIPSNWKPVFTSV